MISVADGLSATLVQVSVFRSATQPVPNKTGDLWVDTSGGTPVYRYCSDMDPITFLPLDTGGGGGSEPSDGDKGDVTVTGSGFVWTIDADAVTNAKLADMPTLTLKGNNTGGSANPLDLTASQVRTLLNVANGATANSSDATLLDRANHTGTQIASTISDFSEAVDDRVSTLLVAGTNITLTYNDGAGTLTIDATGGGSLSDGDKGDITVSGSGTVWTIDSGVVTTAKLGGDITTAGKALLDDADAAAQRTTLGLGTAATNSDATLLNRANHTGTQTASTISDFSESVDDRVASLLVAGANITLTYDDVGNALTIASSGGGSISDGDKGDITVSGSGTTWTVDNGVVTLAKQASLAANSIQGNNTGSPATPIALTVTETTAMLNVFTDTVKGLTPASGGGTSTYLRADGTWGVPPGGGGLSDGDKGDITVSGGATVWTIDAGTVTLSKQANLAANSVIGNNTGSSATPIALSEAQLTAMLDIFNTSLQGAVPASGGGTTTYLRADGTWATPAGGGGTSSGRILALTNRYGAF